MENKIQKELRALRVYVVISSVLFMGLIFVAAQRATTKTKFEEIDVERINIVEKDGTLRLAIANRDRSPGVVMGGKYMKSREGQRPGMIFFNDKGDECGGMTWQSEEKGGKVSAEAGLMFDQYNQDQTVGITYSQRNGDRTSGLMVWERPIMTREDMEFLKKIGDLELMPDGPEKTSALKSWREDVVNRGIGGALRVFVGRGKDNDAVVKLNDAAGKPRIILSVDVSNKPSLRFLDENGKVVYLIPEEGLKK